MTDQATLTTIENDIKTNDVVLYMKGTKAQPMCGFSAVVVQILNNLGVKEFKDVNVLADEKVREGIKQFNNWPTIPQLFIKGEFIGGADIAKELFQSGELKKILEDKGVKTAA